MLSRIETSNQIRIQVSSAIRFRNQYKVKVEIQFKFGRGLVHALMQTSVELLD